MKRLLVILTLVLACWSGFFVMAVELLGARLLAPSFGNSIYVWGGVITVFMLALSVGYLAGGQLSLYAPSLPKLGLIVIVAALATLPMLMFGASLVDWVFDRVNDPRYGSLLTSTALFFLPIAISGMVSPYAIRLLVRRLHASGQSAGGLYFVSTFGSAAGTLTTSFWLVLHFEINHIFVGMILVSATLGLLAIALGKAHESV